MAYNPPWVPVRAEAGFDIDGDNQRQHDKPEGLEHTVGRTNVDASLQFINDLRAATRNLTPIDRGLLDLVDGSAHRRAEGTSWREK